MSSTLVADNFSAGLVAAGDNSQANSTQLALLSFSNQVATCAAAADGVKLPLAPILGRPYLVKNSGAVKLRVFPGLGATIDARAANACALVAPGASMQFVASSALQWYSFSLPAGAVAITAARTVEVDESGSAFFVSKAAAYAITLPDPTTCTGARYTFYSGAIAANAVTIGAGAGLIQGRWRQITGAATVAGASATIAFTATSVISDKIEVISNGTTWLAIGDTGLAAGIAFA